MDLATGKVASEFHSYVLPTEEPRLSAFCTELTGITQEKVEVEGAPIRTVLTLFSRWIAEQQQKLGFLVNERREGKRMATFVTW